MSCSKPLHILIPLHITCFWSIHWGSDYLDTGSTGAGLVLSPGAYIVVEPSSTNEILVNNSRVELPHLRAVQRLLRSSQRVSMKCVTLGQLGYGYGLSAALTIAATVYIGLARGLPLDKCLDLAHVIEVKLRTGLGDVVAEVRGGPIEIRVRPGAPSVAVVRKIMTDRRVSVLVAELSRQETTPTMLTERYMQIQRAGREALARLLENPSLDTLLELANWFSREVGFLSKNLDEKLASLRRCVRGYFVKKRLLVVIPELDWEVDVEEFLKKEFRSVKKFSLEERGLRILT